MSATYYMTTKHHSTTGQWEPCKAKTLRAAKAEATREMGSGYSDHLLCVGQVMAEDDYGQKDIQTVASRLIRDDRWS